MAAERSALPIERWLRLALAPEIGPATARRLIEAFGSPEAIFSAPPGDLARVEGLGPKRLASLLSADSEKRASAELAKAAALGVALIPQDAPGYPPSLLRLANPPLVVYVLGDLIPRDRLAVAIVGPRKPSDYARAMTRALVPPLCARGLAIVSGLAYGVDAEAHQAAVECDGRTIAVLAQGLDTPVFPATNRKLAARILSERRGALLSIFPFGTKPEAGLFPARNEIIAALALGTLVVEAGESSGSLITARHAAELGAPVMACPGDATRPNARGANRLIADGAPLIQNSDDVLGAMAAELRNARAELHEPEPAAGPLSDDSERAALDGHPEFFSRAGSAPSAAVRSAADPLESGILETLAQDCRSIDYVIEACADLGFNQSQVVQKLLLLELNGRIRQLPGRVYALAL